MSLPYENATSGEKSLGEIQKILPPQLTAD